MCLETSLCSLFLHVVQGHLDVWVGLTKGLRHSSSQGWASLCPLFTVYYIPVYMYMYVYGLCV